MWYVLLTALALADEPQEATEAPPRPEATEPVAGECSDAVALEVGKPIPPSLLDDQGRVRCSGVLLPNSMYVDLENDRTWALQLSDRYKYDMAAMGYRHRALQLELEWSRERIAQLEQPPPWTDRPGVQRWAGRLETLAAVLVVGVIVVNIDGLDFTNAR